jgi:hypothetical protein
MKHGVYQKTHDLLCMILLFMYTNGEHDCILVLFCMYLTPLLTGLVDDAFVDRCPIQKPAYHGGEVSDAHHLGLARRAIAHFSSTGENWSQKIRPSVKQ